MAAGDLWLAGNTPNDIYRSTDGGVTWDSTGISAPAVQTSVQGIAVAPNGDLWLVGFGPNDIYRSTDNGVTWDSAGISTPAGQNAVTGIAAAPNGDLWLVGRDLNDIYLSTDNGVTWDSTGISAPAVQTSVQGIAVAPNGDLWLAGNTPDDIYRSTDGGVTWDSTGISAPAGQNTVTGIAVAPNGDLWLVGTTPDDIYLSTDNGVTWDSAGISAPAGQSAVIGIAFDPRAVVEELAFSARAGNPEASFNLTAVAPPSPEELSFSARAGGPTAAFALTAVAPVVLLTLADSDDTGLEVDCKALLVASEDGSVGNFVYEDADRGGTDTPLDGELGLGDDDVLISGIRRRTSTLLQLNDNNNPAALDIGAYFSTGGAGADLTIYLQTLADGEVSFPASNASFSRVDQVRFTLPADAQTLFDNLADGDRFIFKTARPEPVVPEELSFSATAGDPEASFNLTAVAPPPPGTQELAFAARAGNPTAAFALTAVPPSTITPEELAFTARAGDPTASFALTRIAPAVPEELAFTARAGNPTAAFNLRSLIPQPPGLRLSVQAPTLTEPLTLYETGGVGLIYERGISAIVRKVDLYTGRDSVASAGTLRTAVDNRDGLFSPDGMFAPQWRDVLIAGVVNGVAVIFVGRAERIAEGTAGLQATIHWRDLVDDFLAQQIEGVPSRADNASIVASTELTSVLDAYGIPSAGIDTLDLWLPEKTTTLRRWLLPVLGALGYSLDWTASIEADGSVDAGFRVQHEDEFGNESELPRFTDAHLEGDARWDSGREQVLNLWSGRRRFWNATDLRFDQEDLEALGRTGPFSVPAFSRLHFGARKARLDLTSVRASAADIQAIANRMIRRRAWPHSRAQFRLRGPEAAGLRIGDGLVTDFALGVRAGRGLSGVWRVQGRTVDLLSENVLLYCEARDGRDADYQAWQTAGGDIVDAA